MNFEYDIFKNRTEFEKKALTFKIHMVNAVTNQICSGNSVEKFLVRESLLALISEVMGEEGFQHAMAIVFFRGEFQYFNKAFEAYQGKPFTVTLDTSGGIPTRNILSIEFERHYQVKIYQDGEGWAGHFLDFPYLKFEGSSNEKLLECAKVHLLSLEEMFLQKGDEIPFPKNYYAEPAISITI